MIPATDYLKLLTDSTRTRPFDTRIDSYSTNLALAHSLGYTLDQELTLALDQNISFLNVQHQHTLEYHILGAFKSFNV